MSMIYTPEFYDRERATSEAGARAILPLVFERYHFRTVIDIGCGCGCWCVEAARLGAENALGLDGAWAQDAGRLLPGRGVSWHFIARDLCAALPAAIQLWGLAICLETVEHLPPTRGPGLVRELCMLSPIVLWSAATPGQCGEGHVNEQPERYWERLFAEYGYRPDRWIREAIAERDDVPSWYRSNVMLYLSPGLAEPRLAGIRSRTDGCLGGADGPGVPGATSGDSAGVPAPHGTNATKGECAHGGRVMGDAIEFGGGLSPDDLNR